MLLTGSGALSDSMADWFPALTQRRSLNTVFGTEWVQSASLRKEIEQDDALQSCLYQDESCLAAWAKQTGLQFTHVLIQKNATRVELLASLHESEDYKLVYENAAVAIFAPKTPVPTS